jgi:hypothetical protein
MNDQRGYVIAFLAALVIASNASAESSSEFTANDDGWRIVDLTLPADPVTPAVLPASPIHQTVGGNPSGYIEFTDPSDLSFYFDAPAKFLGNRLPSYGAALKYDQFTTPTAPEWRNDPDVILVSGSDVLVYQFPANPGLDWTSYSVVLHESAFHKGTLAGSNPTQAEFQAVLSSLSALRIRGEYVAGVVERTGLDNVILVPEPGTGVSALAAAAGAVFVRPRRARRRR